MTLTHDQFLIRWKGKRFKEPGYTYQCVALVKLYYKTVFGYYFKSFGGSAKNGWLNAFNTFPEKDFSKKTGKEFKSGDVVFIDTEGTIEHVGIFHKWSDDGTKVYIIEQNRLGSGTGNGADAISIGAYPYDQVLGYYTYKNNTSLSPTEEDLLIQELVNIGVTNGKELERWVTRREVLILIGRLYNKLKGS